MKYAGFWVRLMAHNIDLIILLPFFYALSFFIPENRTLYLSCFLLAIVYEAAFLKSKWSGTPGKRVVKIKVTNRDHRPLSLPQAIGRTLCKCLSVPTLFIGYLFVMLSPRRQGFHDLLSGSRVIFIQKD